MKKNGKKKRDKIFLQGEHIPEDMQYAYILAGNGKFIRKKNKLFTAVVEAKAVPGLEDCKVSCRLNKDLPYMPYSLIRKAHEFFVAVYEKHKSEAILLLTLEDGKWDLHPPEQEASSAHVKYEGIESIAPVGDIHSHCGMSAFYSGTDNADDSQIDGIHIVLGKIERSIPEIVVSITVNGTRFTLEPEYLIDGLPEAFIKVDKEHPWLDKVNKKVWQTTVYSGSRHYGEEYWNTGRKDSRDYWNRGGYHRDDWEKARKSKPTGNVEPFRHDVWSEPSELDSIIDSNTNLVDKARSIGKELKDENIFDDGFIQEGGD